MVKIGEVRQVEVPWKDFADLDFAVRHHLTVEQQRSLQLIHQDLSSIDISYNLFAEARAYPDMLRAAFHHAKCYVAAIKRFHRLVCSLGRDGWPTPIASKLKLLLKRDGPSLEAYTAARNAIEHVDEQGRAALWWMALIEEDLAVSKERNGKEIKVRVVGGDALRTAVRFFGDFLRTLVDHWGRGQPPMSTK